MAVNPNELAVGKEVKVRGDGSSWEIIELKGDVVRAINKTNGTEGDIPVQLIVGVVNKAVADIPSSDIQIINPIDAGAKYEPKGDGKKKPAKRKRGRPKKEDK